MNKTIQNNTLDIRNLTNFHFGNLEIYKRALDIYLNKSCFNDISCKFKSFFNVPSAKKDRIIAYDRDNILEQRFLLTNIITITNKDFLNQ